MVQVGPAENKFFSWISNLFFISDNFLQPSNPILLFDMFKSKRSFEKFLNNIEAPKYPILLLLKFI